MSSKRWQYQVIEVKSSGVMGGFKTEKLQEELNRAGAQGWKLVNIAFAVIPPVIVFKREQ